MAEPFLTEDHGFCWAQQWAVGSNSGSAYRELLSRMRDHSPLSFSTMSRTFVGNIWPVRWYWPVVYEKTSRLILVFLSIKNTALPITTPPRGVCCSKRSQSSTHIISDALVRRGGPTAGMVVVLLPLNKQTDSSKSWLMSRSRRRHSAGCAFGSGSRNLISPVFPMEAIEKQLSPAICIKECHNLPICP